MIRPVWRWLGAMVLASGFFASWPAMAVAPVKVADNVFVVADPEAKSTTFWMIIKAGCQDEAHANCRGLAHYLEHLIFLGRNADHKNVAARFFPDADANGYTSLVSTVFFQRFPKRPEGQTADLEKLFRFYSEKLQMLEVNEDDALRERNVVMQEYNMNYARSPVQKFFQTINRTMDPLHPRGQSAIGRKEDIESFTVDEARAFQNAWYTKGNSAFVVYGPVEVEDVRKLAATFVTSLPDRRSPDRAWLNSLNDYSPMSVVHNETDKDTRQRMTLLARTVRYEETDKWRAEYARSVVTAFLTSSLDGSPKDHFVDDLDIASSVSGISLSDVSAGAMRLDMVFVPRDGVDDARILKEASDYIADLAQKGLKPETVERLKKRAAEGRARDEQNPQRVASALVSWLSERGTIEDFGKRAEYAAAVTVDDVNAILRALAQPGRQVVGSLSPAP